MIPPTPTMSVLGTMMLRAGLLSESEATAADEHAATRSISHVDAILELGLADEDTLVAFLASKLMIPRVRSAVLERVGPPTIQRLPALLAWDFKCVPVSFDELGNLTVAMTDPTDPRAITALAEQGHAYLVRAVGTASELRRALERHYGPEHSVRERAAAAARAGVDVSEADRPTELGLEPVRHRQPPPGIRNPAPQPPAVAPPVTHPITPPVPSAPSAPYMAGSPAFAAAQQDNQRDVGRIPADDDDVPIRSHGAAREVISGPVEQHYDATVADDPSGPITDVQTGPPPGSDDPTGPITNVQIGPPPEADDPHQRPTVVETQGPAGRGPRRPRAHTPWNPPLQGFSPVPLSPEAFAQVVPKLEDADDRDAVTTVLLDFLGAGFNRVILFVHSHNELRGLDARGKDLMVEAVRQVRIPSTGKSMFSEVLERGTPFFGPIQSASKIDLAFSQALGGIKGNVLLLPITLGSKVPLLLWAHGSNYPVDPHSITELSTAVSAAIQRIISAARKR
jgi:hypothetical protein